MWKLLLGIIRIVRPLNCLMFFAGTYVGGILAAGTEAFEWPRNLPLVLASLSATLVGASGNVLNDILDIEIDRLNRPRRPLPAGLLAATHARALWVILVVGGVIIAVAVSPLHAGLAVAAGGLLYAYNARLKSVPIVGNTVVGVVVGVALVYGSLSLGGPGPAIPAAVFAFLTTVAREVIKDVQDLEGDRAHASNSYAVKSGADAAARLTVALLTVTVMLSPVPFLVLDYSGLYLLLMLFADALLLAALWTALRRDSLSSAGRASRWTKFAMVVGLAALAVSSVGQA